MTIALVLAVVLLAYANGGNDTFKGVATLYGSGTTTLRRALAYATLTAALGALAALVLGEGLVAAFGGAGLVPDDVVTSSTFATAVASGAAATVLLATALGLPVSTTHALTGALVGAGGVLAGAGQVDLTRLGGAFLLPLLVSPLLALVLAAALHGGSRLVRGRVRADDCVCVGPGPVPVAADGVLASVDVAPLPALVLGEAGGTCAPVLATGGAGLTAGTTLDAAHYLSAGAVCFARALNDAPKLVGILAASGAVSLRPALLLAGAAMAVGGLVHSRRVAETMAKNVAALDAGTGLTANVVTAALVLGASRLSLPVSTTHVACGALFGIGAATGTARADVIAQILLAWVTTLPLSAACAALVAVALG